MWIKRLKVQNFKSLVDFEMQLDKFTCLIGLNGSGKSSVLQFLDFLSRLFVGRVDVWLGDRNWEADELKSFGSNSDLISFEIEFGGLADRIVWEGKFSVEKLRCTTELFKVGEKIIEANDVSDDFNSVKIKIGQEERELHQSLITPNYPSAIRSAWIITKELQSWAGYREVIEFLETIQNLEFLDPTLMRSRLKGNKSFIGRGGRNLITFLDQLSSDQKTSLENSLRTIFNRFSSYLIKPITLKTNQFLILEKFRNVLQTSENHINDGFLRTTAIFASILSSDKAILIDEIENGFNLEITETIIDALVASPKQVIVTTHSPVVLNFLDKEQAQKSVVYLYRDDDGGCKSIRFFDIPSMKKKLTVLGPGEVLVDTLLTELDKEIKAQETRKP